MGITHPCNHRPKEEIIIITEYASFDAIKDKLKRQMDLQSQIKQTRCRMIEFTRRFLRKGIWINSYARTRCKELKQNLRCLNECFSRLIPIEVPSPTDEWENYVLVDRLTLQPIPIPLESVEDDEWEHIENEEAVEPRTCTIS